MDNLFDVTKIDAASPISFRPRQKAVIQKVAESFNSGTQFVFLDAPTGSGKSLIGYVLAELAGSAFYLAPQKFLQDQLTRDFGEEGINIKENRTPMIDLKGRNAYPCNYWERVLDDPDYKWGSGVQAAEKKSRYSQFADDKIGCDKGQCKKDGKSKLPYCEGFCPYFNQLEKASESKLCLMNYHSFLYQTAVTKKFNPRQLLILDEAHDTSDVLLKFIELKISDASFNMMGIKFPCFDTVSSYINYFEEIDLVNLIVNKIKMAVASGDSKQEDEWKNTLLKYEFLLEADPDEWVVEYEVAETGLFRTISLKPIYIDKFCKKYLFSMAKYVLFMSATILSKDVMCNELGIEKHNSKMFKIPCLFPKEIRPIKYKPSGSMNYNNKSETLKQMAKDVNKICDEHKDEKGIIHTHNFEILDYLLENCSNGVSSRFLNQKDEEFEGNKQNLLNKHKDSKNSIIIAPAMHQGLDLKDDLGRFQIVCKVPYPPMKDIQIAAKMKIDRDWYNWKCCTKICQSIGRIHRHDKDWGVTYILDADFKKFYNQNEDMIPDWIKEVIKWS